MLQARNVEINYLYSRKDITNLFCVLQKSVLDFQLVLFVAFWEAQVTKSSLYFLVHGFGQDEVVKNVNDCWPSPMIDMSVGAHPISNVRLPQFIAPLLIKIG